VRKTAGILQRWDLRRHSFCIVKAWRFFMVASANDMPAL
jgi:hypothetical protein